MSHTTTPVEAGAVPSVSAPAAPRRRTLVALSAAILVIFVVMMGTSADLSYDARLADITDAYQTDETLKHVTAYVGMVLVALLLFFGAALRGAIRGQGRTWLADASFFGFGALAATIASWGVIDVALWQAVDLGDEGAIRSIAALNDSSFLPLMASMMAIYIGTALAGRASGTLPGWLVVASLVVGVLAPLGPLGFIGAVLLPLWVLVVALTVRLDA